MSRSGYTDDCDGWGLICWRGAVKSAMRGARGQAFLREVAAAMDAMPEKSLIPDSLKDSDGDFCTLGVVGAARGLDMAAIDPDDRESVARAFGIAPSMAAEIMYENDEGGPWAARWGDAETPEQRWTRMRAWVQQQIDASLEASNEGASHG